MAGNFQALQIQNARARSLQKCAATAAMGKEKCNADRVQIEMEAGLQIAYAARVLLASLLPYTHVDCHIVLIVAVVLRILFLQNLRVFNFALVRVPCLQVCAVAPFACRSAKAPTEALAESRAP